MLNTKKITLIALLLCASFSINAQVNTTIRIYHTLGTELFQMNNTTQNNLAQDYQVTRIQYYMTRMSVVHDGGQITAISDDTVALINATDGTFSTIELGSLNITDVEAVKFHIGVHTPVNNEDPSLYSLTHPLGPKSPSMHWGWASGYRFLVYEGVGGVNFSQAFQLHALGNNNYFETTVSALGEMAGGDLVIALDADYTRGAENIDVSNGIVAHGVDGADLTSLENFRDFVFSQSVLPLFTSTDDLESEVQWGVFPNPSNDGKIVVSIDSNATVDEILISDILGKEVTRINYGNLKSQEINIATSGTYFIQLLTNSSVASTKRVVIQ